MTEEEKRYSESEAGLIFDSKTGWYIHGLVVDRLNAYESRVKELEEKIKELRDEARHRSIYEDRRDEAIEMAIDNINCDASEAAMRPLLDLMEGK
jgi:hypothetical protein